MDVRELGRLDLNLLVALQALLEERSVSAAAERLYITQSAMSKTLGRLREVFGDPLFVRQGSAMVPTPRAEQLGLRLPEVLAAVQSLVQALDFDPLAYDGTLRVMTEGNISAWFMPGLIERLRHTAPRLRLQSISDSRDLPARLASGDIDLAVQVERLNYPRGLDLTTLAFAGPMLLARKGHPLEGTEYSFDDLLGYPQVRLSTTDILEMRYHEGDASLVQEYERAVEPLYEVDDLQTAVQIVGRTDCLLPAPPLFINQFNLSSFVVPLPIPGLESISIKYVAVRHERVIGSPPQDFLYSEVIALTEAFRASNGLPSLADLRRQRQLPY